MLPGASNWDEETLRETLKHARGDYTSQLSVKRFAQRFTMKRAVWKPESVATAT